MIINTMENDLKQNMVNNNTNTNTNTNITDKNKLKTFEKKIMLNNKCKYNINNINYCSDDNEMTQLGYDG